MKHQTIFDSTRLRNIFQISKFSNLILIAFLLLKFDVGWSQNCANNAPCQINQFWNFESFTSQDVMREVLTVSSQANNYKPFLIDPYPFKNTPDLLTTPTSPLSNTCGGAAISESGNGTARIGLYTELSPDQPKSRSEGIAIPLCEPIFPGMKGKIVYNAFIANNCIAIEAHPEVRFDFSTNPPVSDVELSTNPGIAPNSTYLKAITSSEATIPHYGTYTVQIENTSTQCWNYLYVSGKFSGSFAYPIDTYWNIDNIELILENKISDLLDVTVAASTLSPCPGNPVDITVNVCNNVECQGGTYTNPSFTITPNLPAGLTLAPGSPALTVAQGEIPYGSCKIFTFSVLVENNSALIGQNLPVQLSIAPDLPCNLPETILGATITPVYCAPPISCTCPPGGTIYSVNPGAGVPITLSASGLPSSVSNACIELNGLLILNGDLNLQNVEVIANPGSQIEIQAGRTLTAKKTNFSACVNMWQGIRIDGGATANSGGTLRLDGAVNERNSIRDAQYAVTAFKNANLLAQYTDFDKNYTGIYVPPPTSGSVNLLGTIPFNQCTFTCTANLLPPYTSQLPTPGTRAYLAFDLNNVLGFNIGTEVNNTLIINGLRNGLKAKQSVFSIRGATMSNFTGPSANNWEGVRAENCKTAKVLRCTINDYRTGVIATGSNLTVNRGILRGFIGSSQNFQDIGIFTTPGGSKETILTDNMITFSEIGIKISSLTVPLATSEVKNNSIEAFEYYSGLKPVAGIFLTNVRKLQFTSNYIGEKQSAATTGQKHIGIYANRCFDNTFNENHTYSMKEGYYALSCSNNYFLGNTADRSAATGAGIPEQGFLQLGGGMNNRYCCNAIDHILHNGFNFQGSCLGTDFQQSKIYSAETGLRLGLQNNPTISNVTKIEVQFDKKNRWLGSYSSTFGAIHESNNEPNIQQSKFTTATNWVPLWNTGLGNSFVSWFVGQGTGIDQPTCNCPPPPPPGFGGNNDNVRFGSDPVTAVNGFGAPYADVSNWEAQRNLYGRLSNYYSDIINTAPPSGLSSSELTAYNNGTSSIAQFYASANSNNSLVRQYHNQATGMGLLWERPTADQTALAQAVTRVQLWNDSLSRLNDLPASPANEALKNNALSQLAQYAGQYETTLNTVKQSQATELTQLMQSNNQLTASFDFQLKERDLNTLYLQGRFCETTPVNPNWTGIKTIADLCPWSFGPVVYQARAMFMDYNPDYYWKDDQICGFSSEQRSDSPDIVKTANDWKIAPNPSNTYIRLTNSGTSNGSEKLQIFGVYGNLVIDTQLASDTREFIFSTEFWPAGIYFYRIIDGANKNPTGQFVVTH